jgi:uncharacterized protein YecT (DUF1311 family)
MAGNEPMQAVSRVWTLPVVAAIALICAAVAPAVAQTSKATAADRAAIEACLKLVSDNEAAEAAKPGDPPAEKPGAAERLRTAANDAPTDRESCIGAVANACAGTPEGESTMGMVQCSDRELAVWDERLNAAYKDAIATDDAKIKAGLLQTQRAWLAYRDALCAMPALENAGGSIIGPLTEACLMAETAKQAIWLEDRN